MAESQKETSSVNPKEKKSLLDDDIGKEFLSSWKSMSVTEDDTMDFNFTAVSTGKKKAFDFEKLDMDFNLDGDFNKLSSFKVDMSDFDFSSPSKNVVKTKERSEQESSTGNQKGKKNQFDFSFDFNELDSFNFDSSLMKEEKASNKNLDGKMEISSDGTEIQGSKIQLSEGVNAFDDTAAAKLQACEDVVTSKVETLLADSGHLISVKNDSAKCVTSGAAIVSHGAGSSPEKVMTNRAEALDKQSHLSEKEISSELYSQKANLDFSGQSLAGIGSKRYLLLDGQTDSFEQGRGLQTTSNPKDVNEKIMAVVLSNPEKLPLKDSSTHKSTSGNNNDEINKSGSDISIETVDGIVSVEDDINFEENLTSFVPRKAQHDVNGSKEKQSSTTELPLAFLCREGLNSNDAQTGVEFSGNPLLVARELTKGKDVLQEGAKHVKILRNIRESFVSDGLLNGSKLVGNSRMHDEEATKIEPVMPASDKNVKDQNTLGLQVCPSSSFEKQTKSSNQQSVNSKLFVSSMESVRERDPKIKLAEESKLCPIKGGRKMPDLSALNISKYRTTEANKVSSNSGRQKDAKSLQNPEQNVKVQGNTASDIAAPVTSTEKKLPLNLSLKRKTFELSNSDLASLKPLKRLSKSLIESRDLKEPLKGVVEEKFSSAEKSLMSDAAKSLMSDAEKSLKPVKCLPVSFGGSRDFEEPLKRVDVKEPLKIVDKEKVIFRENQVESKTKRILYNSPASALESPQEVNMMELKISSIMENDGNVEKAEAYTKELEEICNMLKKKHEEAKEMLVRAIVNNNNLLMLNHPLFEEKICKVQKFAAELLSKELKT